MNNFREWLSDNLRYILLILGILVVLVGLFFGVRALSRRFGSSGNDAFSSDSLVSNASPAVSKASDSTASSVSVSENKGGDLEEDAIPEVTSLIKDYYAAIEQQDVAKVRTLCDTLPETEAAKIASSTTKYTDIKVYTKKGLVADSYVVYAYYHYQNEGQSNPLPGLSRMLVRKTADGSWQIVYSDYDQATSDYIDSLEKEDDVKALVQKVQQEFDAAQKSASENAASSESSSSGTSSSAESSQNAAPSESSASESRAANTESENAATSQQPAQQSQNPSASKKENTSAQPSEKEQNQQPSRTQQSSGNSSHSNGTRTTALQADCFIRSAPSYSGSVVGQLKKGTAVTVVGDIKDGWWHIRANGYDGYVGRRFIS